MSLRPFGRLGATTSDDAYALNPTFEGASCVNPRVMKSESVQFEIAGPTAMWTRPDTGDAPVSYPAPTFSAAKGMFESICWLKSANVNPVKVEVCAPLIFHTYSTNYGGPLRKSKIMKKGSSFQLLATVLINVIYRL